MPFATQQAEIKAINSTTATPIETYAKTLLPLEMNSVRALSHPDKYGIIESPMHDFGGALGR